MESETMIFIDMLILTGGWIIAIWAEWIYSIGEEIVPQDKEIINDLKKSRNGKYPRKLKTVERQIVSIFSEEDDNARTT